MKITPVFEKTEYPLVLVMIITHLKKIFSAERKKLITVFVLKKIGSI